MNLKLKLKSTLEYCLDFFRDLGKYYLSFFARVGQSFIFLLQAIFVLPKRPIKWNLFVKQIYNVGFLSLVIIVISGTFIGMVLGLQGYIILSKFGADKAVGQLVALSMVRELGPVVSALLFAGRAGSALTAEIGLMRATEQLSSMEIIGVSPIARVVAPRFWAGQICLPILCIIFIVCAIYGGALVSVDWIGVDEGAFWANMQAAVEFSEDVVNGMIKSLVFATVITWIALYQGYYCEENADGIAKATTSTVVYSSVLVLILDFFITAVMFGGN